MAQEIRIKRIYEPSEPNDGFRIYIDRLWPRGISHENFHCDLWDKDIAPSTELREEFHTDRSAEWSVFETRYHQELLSNPAFKQLLTTIADKPIVTLLYSSRDTEHNNAIILRDTILQQNQPH